ncbi:MAG: esterase, partial [Chitinophagaceae bacterium]
MKLMQTGNLTGIHEENKSIQSEFLGREVTVDFFLPLNIDDPSTISLLLINDGQNMQELGLTPMLEELMAMGAISPVLCVGIHAGPERKLEYGVASQPDYLGRGSKAGLYSDFVLQELLPFIRHNYQLTTFR